MAGVNIDNFKIDSSHEIIVTHINNPHSFYIRPSHLGPLLESLENQPFNLNPPADSVIYGMVVLYRSRNLDKFVRGKICFINSIRRMVYNYDIFAIDYGCFEKSIPLAHVGILDMTHPNSNCPPLAFHSRLHQCEPIGSSFSEDIIDNFKFFLKSDSVFITVMSKIQDKLVIAVRTPNIHDVATLMCLLDYTVIWKPNTVNRMNETSPNSLNLSAMTLTVKSPEFKHKMLECGVTFRARVLSGESYLRFYVAEMNEFTKLMQGKSQLYMDCKDKLMKYDDIVPGRHCAVEVERFTYERAVIQEILEPGHKVKVILLDWGKEAEVNFACIRSVESEVYYDQPIIGIYCTANPDQVREYNLPPYFSAGDQFIVKIIDLGFGFDDPHKVYLYPPN